jgi:hypothetical protein
MSQGAEANHSGRSLEDRVRDEFGKRGVPEYRWRQNRGQHELFVPNGYLVSQVPYAKPWQRKARSRLDFVYYGTKHPRGIAIECKAQDENGSLDLKLPTVVKDIFNALPYPRCILVYEGEGTPADLIDWLKEYARNQRIKQIDLVNWSEFRRLVKEILR